MRTYSAKLRPERRLSRRRTQPLTRPRHPPRAFCPSRTATTLAATASQSGISLIEVLISALIVSVVAIGTLTAFDTAGRASQDQRSHAQAAQLAQQDEERLHSLTSTELANLTTTTQSALPEAENGLCLKEATGKQWEYCTGTAFAGEKYTGTVFQVTPSVSYVSASSNGLSCATTGGGANYIQTSSSVRWPTLATSRPAVTQTSLITDNTTGVLVKVFNQNHEPVEGATVAIKGTEPTFSSSQTTGAVGCVIVTGLTNKKVTVEVSKLSSWVDRAAKLPPASKPVELSPTAVATTEFVIAEPGAIKAEFVSEEGGKEVKAESDTFYAQQNSITPPPENFVEGTVGKPAKTLTLTPVFPFAKLEAPHEPEAYTVYAGDCKENNPETATVKVVKLTHHNEAFVKPGGVGEAQLEVPELNVTVYEGTETKGTVLAASESALLTNTECSAATAQNETVSYKHPVSISGGVLTPKFQPYAKSLSLCVTAKVGTEFVKNTWVLTNIVKAGTTVTEALTKTGGNLLKSKTTKETCP